MNSRQPGEPRSRSLIELQRTAGNAAVAALLIGRVPVPTVGPMVVQRADISARLDVESKTIIVTIDTDEFDLSVPRSRKSLRQRIDTMDSSDADKLRTVLSKYEPTEGPHAKHVKDFLETVDGRLSEIDRKKRAEERAARREKLEAPVLEIPPPPAQRNAPRIDDDAIRLAAAKNEAEARYRALERAAVELVGPMYRSRYGNEQSGTLAQSVFSQALSYVRNKVDGPIAKILESVATYKAAGVVEAKVGQTGFRTMPRSLS